VAWTPEVEAQTGTGPDESSTLPTPSTLPPPVGNPYVQYGVAFTTEFVTTPGAICSVATSQPCILGSGGGVVFPRVGWRSAGPWYLGGAYEISKQDAFTLYQLPILQQLRGEARSYFLIGQVLTPFLGASAGIAGYGNEWSVDTLGPDGSITFGIEAQASRRTVIGLALDYRGIYFRSFTDSSGTAREGGLAQLVGLDLQLEVRDPY
jgi:hypothetical protein